MNQWHVNDWTLNEFEQELRLAGGDCFESIELKHFQQPLGSVLLHPGREPESSFWAVVARGTVRPGQSTMASPVSVVAATHNFERCLRFPDHAGLGA